jgi:hypothetical protein
VCMSAWRGWWGRGPPRAVRTPRGAARHALRHARCPRRPPRRAMPRSPSTTRAAPAFVRAVRARRGGRVRERCCACALDDGACGHAGTWCGADMWARMGRCGALSSGMSTAQRDPTSQYSHATPSDSSSSGFGALWGGDWVRRPPCPLSRELQKAAGRSVPGTHARCAPVARASRHPARRQARRGPGGPPCRKRPPLRPRHPFHPSSLVGERCGATHREEAPGPEARATGVAAGVSGVGELGEVGGGVRLRPLAPRPARHSRHRHRHRSAIVRLPRHSMVG